MCHIEKYPDLCNICEPIVDCTYLILFATVLKPDRFFSRFARFAVRSGIKYLKKRRFSDFIFFPIFQKLGSAVL
jgi:hypothetical protein